MWGLFEALTSSPSSLSFILRSLGACHTSGPVLVTCRRLADFNLQKPQGKYTQFQWHTGGSWSSPKWRDFSSTQSQVLNPATLFLNPIFFHHYTDDSSRNFLDASFWQQIYFLYLRACNGFHKSLGSLRYFRVDFRHLNAMLFCRSLTLYWSLLCSLRLSIKGNIYKKLMNEETEKHCPWGHPGTWSWVLM